jgi:hypothetical protein
MADRAYVLHRLDDPVLGVGDGLEDKLYGYDVVGALVLYAYVGYAGGLVVDDGAFLADALDDARGEDVLLLPIVDLVLDGRAAAIKGEYDHGDSP